MLSLLVGGLFPPMAFGSHGCPVDTPEKVLVRRTGDKQVDHIRHGDAVLVSSNQLNRIAGRHFSLLRDRHVEAGLAAAQKALHHVRAAKPDAELEARHARLRNYELSRTSPQAVSDVNRFLDYTFGREILSEHPPGKVHAGKFLAPERIMLRWVDIDSLIDSAVHREIGLLVALYVQARNPNTWRHWRLEDGCADALPLPVDLTRKPHVD